MGQQCPHIMSVHLDRRGPRNLRPKRWVRWPTLRTRAGPVISKFQSAGLEFSQRCPHENLGIGVDLRPKNITYECQHQTTPGQNTMHTISIHPFMPPTVQLYSWMPLNTSASRLHMLFTIVQERPTNSGATVLAQPIRNRTQEEVPQPTSQIMTIYRRRHKTTYQHRTVTRCLMSKPNDGPGPVGGQAGRQAGGKAIKGPVLYS